MGTIAILPPQLANRIAAGEVVERPASVVKELVENALDAGARRITVALEDGGRRRISVQDDGRGMSAEDMALAIQRHATSKIRSADDLTGITTLGFRGEALPSIAAVARLEIISRRPGKDRAFRLKVAGGEVKFQGPAGAPVGTQINVTDLFFNTPGRRKGMHSATTELARTTEILQSAALGHPETSFRFSHNGRLLWRTTGAGDLAAAALQVLGPAMARMMVPVHFIGEGAGEMGDGSPAPGVGVSEVSAVSRGSPGKDGGARPHGGGAEKPPQIKVSGLVGLPRAARASRSHQFFIVNGRPVRSDVLREAAEDAYRHLLPMHRYPVWVLHVEVPPGGVDVNVHPSKITVRFTDEHSVAKAVKEAAAAALRRADLVPRPLRRAAWGRKEGVQTDIGPIPTPRSGGTGRGSPGGKAPEGDSGGTRGRGFDATHPYDKAAGALADAPHGIGGPYSGTAGGDGPYGRGTGPTASVPLKSSGEATGGGRAGGGEAAGGEAAGGEAGGPDAGSGQKDGAYGADSPGQGMKFRRLPPLRVLGVIDRTYIAAAGPDGLYLIDQHAAHERIYFEEFMKQGRISPRLRQTLAVPLPVDLSPYELAVWEEEKEHIEAFGFRGERFGPSTVLLREVPWLHRGQETGEHHLQELLAGLMQARRRGESISAPAGGLTRAAGPSPHRGGRREAADGGGSSGAADPSLLHADLAMRAMASCKTAVKAQDTLSPAEVDELLALLADTDNPYTCPHGRPTIISVTIGRIERWFHRA